MELVGLGHTVEKCLFSPALLDLPLPSHGDVEGWYVSGEGEREK